ncbi:Retrovirus-related Pol polyprotein from transposon 17.6, partial [Mucuna pruriens]
MEKFMFRTNEVIFLGYVVGSQGVLVDEEKVKAIQSWPTPTNYHCCPIKETIKKDVGFKLSNSPILALPKFHKSFELECDASNVGVRVVLLEEGHPIAFLNEKLKGAQLNFTIYDKELYALAKVLQVWQHYLLSNEFIVHNDHNFFMFTLSSCHSSFSANQILIRGQHKLNKRHAKWVEFLEKFPYVIKHKQGKANIVANALSRRHALLAMLETKLLGFESLKNLYVGDDDFKKAYESCANSANGGFFKHKRFLFKEKRLCVLRTSIRELLVREAHEGGLMGYFDERKTYETLHENFYWPHMRRDVHHICERCLVCKMAKSKVLSKGLYTPLPIPTSP